MRWGGCRLTQNQIVIALDMDGDVGLAGQSGLPPRERGVSATEDKFYV